jgi:hypothetical protein
MQNQTFRPLSDLLAFIACGLSILAVVGSPVSCLGAATHTGGKVQNNFISDTRTSGYPGPGISLEYASGALVDNNTVYQAGTYANAIEYRYADTTGGYVRNNLTNKPITARDSATATLATNLVTA